MQRPAYRYNSYHGPKQGVLGNQAGHAAPAWRAGALGVNGAAGSSGRKLITNPGSKILLSRLPPDVTEKEVDELFKKTVGPLKEAFLIYNSQGNSKGMALVSFQHSDHAAVAKSKYDGKYVDGRRPIKIEIVSDDFTVAQTQTPRGPTSLLDRIGKLASTGSKPASVGNHALPRQVAAAASIASKTLAHAPTAPRKRQKKGPKRLKKLQAGPKSAEQLDQEMEDYRASVDASNVGS